MIFASLFLFVGAALAQTTVTGTVVSQDDREPVVGARVMLKDMQIGTITDANGHFTLHDVPASAKILQVSCVGMQTVEEPIKPNMRIVMRSDQEMLNEMVVTALGISRSEKSLGYSATTVKGDDIVKAEQTNIANALAGKVAGVQVSSTSSDPGSVTNIVIRGFSSINGDNQPLYVVDGVPMQQNSISKYYNGKNIAIAGVGNIAADDIETLTVLKGAAATALYGSRAANGAVIITTKKGQKGEDRNFTISYNGSMQARRVSTLPDYQNEFGQGWDGKQTFIENGSWGPALDGSLQVYGPIWNGQQRIHEYSAKKNNVKDFFDTGWSQSHDLSIGGVSNDGKMDYYLSYSYNGDNGIMPTKADLYKRNTIAFRNSYEATKWLKVSSSINFARGETDAVMTYQGTSVIDGLYNMPRDVSVVDLKDTSNPFNTPEAYFTPYSTTNPYWSLENNYNHTSSKQLYGKVQVDIKPYKDVTLTYRMGFDYSDYDNKEGEPQIDLDDALIDNDYGYAPSHRNQTGYVYSRFGRRYELNHDFLANYSSQFFDDRFDVNVNVGVNLNERHNTRMTSQADDLTFYTGFWRLNNGSDWTTMSESMWKRRSVGLFADITLGWDDMIYLDVMGRNDWSSTLPINANSYFYPGATLSWIFTRLIPQNKALTFGKIRLAYGKTGNDAGTYETGTTYSQATANGIYGNGIASFPMNGTNAFQSSNTMGSTTLKPEMTREFEFGGNLQFFNGRIGLDFAYYNRTTSDQIFTLPVDPSTGYYYMVTNFGKVRNKGVELLINVVPVQTKDWRWELSFNYAKNRNKVLSLPESLEDGKVQLYSYVTGSKAFYLYAEEGKPMGEYYTYLPTYTDDGQMIVDSNGQPVLSTTVEDTGKNMNYKWTGGVGTSLTWRFLTLSAQLDIRKGGYMFSRTAYIMQFTGNGAITTFNGRNPFIIPNSVVDNGDGTYSPNTTPIYQTNGTMQDYFDDYGYGLGGESMLIDRSFVKLRNLSLTWNLPKKWVHAMTLSDVSLTAFCNNVFTWTAKDNRYVDPESTSISQSEYGDLATQFGETYVNPSCRVFGLSLSVKY